MSNKQNINENNTRMNGLVSASRNCFLLTTVGVAVFGFGEFANKRKSKKFIFVRLLSFIIYVVAFLYLVNICLAFYKYINDIKAKNITIPEYDLLYFERHLYILMMYGGLVLIPLIFVSSKKFFHF